MAMIFQSYALWPHMTVAQNVAYGLRFKRGLARADRDARVGEMLRVVQLAGYEGRYPGELSGGERQRAVLARALAQDARILLLDEPTAFLDLRHAVLLLDLVRDLCRSRALAVAVVLHDLNLAAMYCDRLVLLDRGRVHAAGTPAAVLTYRDLCTVYGTELYVAPNDVTGQLVVLPLSREYRERLQGYSRG